MRNIVGAGAVGVAAAIAFSTPAFACHPVADATYECKPDKGIIEITWKVRMDENKNATITELKFDPKARFISGGIKTDVEISKSKVVTGVMTVPLDFKEANLDLVTVYNKKDKATGHGKITLNCAPPSPSPSTSASASVKPSTSASASVTPSSSKTSGGSLPVTGSNIGIMGGIAVVLLGAGAALFFIARRRRVSFTA